MSKKLWNLSRKRLKLKHHFFSYLRVLKKKNLKVCDQSTLDHYFKPLKWFFLELSSTIFVLLKDIIWCFCSNICNLFYWCCCSSRVCFRYFEILNKKWEGRSHTRCPWWSCYCNHSWRSFERLSIFSSQRTYS